MQQCKRVPDLLLFGAVAVCALIAVRSPQLLAAEQDPTGAVASAGIEFESPIRLKAGDEYVSVEPPGWACPTMADVDQDGLDDLVVGQFSNGHMQFCKNVAKPGEAPQFAAPEWIKTGSDRAVVPGVW